MLDLAETLRKVSLDKTADAFYKGELTQQIVNEINENGGNVTVKDFNDYEVVVHENNLGISLNKNYRVYVPPPPSNGVLIPFILKLMQGFDLKAMKNMTNDETILFYHRLNEAFKHAYAKRTFLGDLGDKTLNLENV